MSGRVWLPASYGSTVAAFRGDGYRFCDQNTRKPKSRVFFIEFLLGRSAPDFPPYRSRLHIAVIGNFIFIFIRTAATGRASAIDRRSYPQNPQERGPGAK